MMKNLFKYLASMMLVISIGLSSIIDVSAATISVYINGEKQMYDQPPVMENGRTLVPLRGIFESLGAEVKWDSNTRKITATKGDKVVLLTIGSKTTYVNNLKINIDVPAKMINNRTVVPLRFVSEAFDAEVKWDGVRQRVNITYEDTSGNDPEPSRDLSISEIVRMNDSKVVKIETNTGQGSGVFVGEGLILTNAHVVDEMTEAAVYLNKNTMELVEGIVAYDEAVDLALLKLSRPVNINPVSIGASSKLEKGEKVVAIGSPLGFQNTVSDGIVSNLYELDGVRVIQNTASTDHGSSGGGLFNMQGELVGITSSGIDGSNADINFSVAIEEANQWKSYFSMDHSKLPVMEWNPFGPTLISGVSLGMTKAEVKDIEIGTLIDETADRLTYSDINYIGYEVTAEYVFENGKLIGLDVSFIDAYLFNRSDAEQLFTDITLDLEDSYGYADVYDMDWTDDEGDPALGALWYGDEVDIPATFLYIFDYGNYGMDAAVKMYISFEHMYEE
ncbi:stalk domain-containing protein [Bacillus sp. E(2018)]|uniref:stalk domain-containing protein n=1 Tax=Bacillus sp. E(2018) TaxID=2502239 RepID=UPI0010F9B95D|nr:stalk domain-containing protein [Bacillus sp. E(2018)]